jgi:hypothetical protein
MKKIGKKSEKKIEKIISKPADIDSTDINIRSSKTQRTPTKSFKFSFG